MTIALASAWHPRGELGRFRRWRPLLDQTYTRLIVSVPPHATQEDIRGLEIEKVHVVVTSDWSHGRHAALREFLDTHAMHVQYADFDRLIHWIEKRPDELKQAATRIQTTDCLVVGRTERAYRTHPQALRQTEAISNFVSSQLLGRTMDFSAGSKGFSRRAVEYLLASSPPGRALGSDSEWPLLLHRAGFAIDYVEVEGLEWESAEHFSPHAADEERQEHAAKEYDADPKHWARRVQIAMEIVECALKVQRV